MGRPAPHPPPTMSSDPPFSFVTQYLENHTKHQPMKIYCALCPEWPGASGTVAEMRALSEQHRSEEHPETFRKSRKLRGKRVFSQALTAERRDEIEEERRQRMRSLGIAKGEDSDHGPTHAD